MSTSTYMRVKEHDLFAEYIILFITVSHVEGNMIISPIEAEACFSRYLKRKIDNEKLMTVTHEYIDLLIAVLELEGNYSSMFSIVQRCNRYVDIRYGKDFIR